MEVKRYKTNPFLENMVIPIKGKNIKVNILGEDENVLINQTTGEIHGTHLTTIKRVDADQFVKLFTQNVGLTFGLTAAGVKSLSVLVWTVQNTAISKDEVDLDAVNLESFLENHDKNIPPLRLSIGTFRRGLTELEKSNIVAKTLRKGRYFINPNFIFNGDRIAFTTLIERKKQEQQSD